MMRVKIRNKISVRDIKNIQPDKPLRVQLPTASACVSARNTVQYVKNVYKRPDGKTYSVATDYAINLITISVVDPPQP